ncbi:MAG: hypothetical protein R3Y11_01620 [Pseudomonadota bacterium]
MEQLQALIPEEYLVYVTGLVAFCAALAVVLTPPSDSSSTFYTYGYQAVQWIALNFGNATNASTASSTAGTTASTTTDTATATTGTTVSETVSSDGNS